MKMLLMPFLLEWTDGGSAPSKHKLIPVSQDLHSFREPFALCLFAYSLTKGPIYTLLSVLNHKTNEETTRQKRTINQNNACTAHARDATRRRLRRASISASRTPQPPVPRSLQYPATPLMLESSWLDRASRVLPAG